MTHSIVTTVGERRALVIASQCASLNLLSFLPDAARDVADALLDPDLGGCVPALADGRSMLVNPIAAELDTAVAAAFERASEDEATLFLALVGHGDYADDDFYFLTHDATSPPDSRTAFHLAQRIKELLGRHSLLDGLVILLDTCHAGVAASQAAARWVHIVGQAGKRFEVLTASDDRTAADGCFSRSLASVLRSGHPELGERLRCPDLKRVVSGACPRQTAVYLAFDGVRTTVKGDQGLWLAVNAAEAWRPLIGNPSAAEIERLTDGYRPTPQLGVLVGHLLMGERCVAVTGDFRSGKSTLVAALARPAIAADVVPARLLHAVLFLTAGQTGEQIAAELARQLCRSVPEFEVARAQYREEAGPGVSAFDLAVVGPLRILTKGWQGGPVRIALDGLDRLGAAELASLTRSIEELVANPALDQVQLVVVARHPPLDANITVISLPGRTKHVAETRIGPRPKPQISGPPSNIRRMVMYAECGHQGPADVEFCGECGRYLKWEDDEPAAARQPPVAQQQVVQPTEPIAPARQPVQQTVEEQVLNPSDLICGRCGKGNAPTRNFCSRCGTSLAESEVVKTSWWQRLFGRKPKEHKAGARPGKGGVRRRVGRAGAARQVGKMIPGVIGIGIAVALALSLRPPWWVYLTGIGIVALGWVAGSLWSRWRRSRLVCESPLGPPQRVEIRGSISNMQVGNGNIVVYNDYVGGSKVVLNNSYGRPAFQLSGSIDVVRFVLRASAPYGPLPLTILARASAKMDGPAHISEMRDVLVQLGDDVLRSQAGSPEETVSLSPALSRPPPWSFTACRALVDAVGELAPANEQHHDTLDQRYARATEAEYLWQLNRFAEAVRSLDERPLTVARENLERWTTWARKAAGKLGDEHPLTLHCRARVAIWTGETGDDAAASARFEELLLVAERVLGAENPETISIRHGAAALRYDK
jgi:hypothetical protein